MKTYTVTRACPKCGSRDVQLLDEDGVSVVRCTDCHHFQEDVGMPELEEWFKAEAD